MKILLTGKSGQLGFELQRALAPLGEVFAVGSRDCDLASAQDVQRLLDGLSFDVIVNAAAYTAVDRAQSDQQRAFAVNAHAPQIMAQEAARRNALLLHYSTDYVFDGKGETFYRESDPACPQNVYGQSKWAGEQAIARSGAAHLILRTSWVVGAHGNNFAKTMLRLACERDRLQVVADQIGAPTPAPLLADVSAHLLRAYALQQGPAPFPCGIYHCVAAGQTHWHAYACHVIEAARQAGWPVRVPSHAIEPVSTSHYPTAAQRPANSRLDTGKLRQTFRLHLPHWQSALDLVLAQMLQQRLA